VEDLRRDDCDRASGEAAMKLDHPQLVELLQRAYSAERAAAFAYVGHAASLKDPAAKAAVKQIEMDEWHHRENVLVLMRQYGVPVSRYYEWRFYFIGKAISLSCHVIGWFMPYYFAGNLESGNVCEYFLAMQHFQSLGIRDHDALLYDMGMKEKEHELYFLEQIRASRCLPFFERLFGWGVHSRRNDVDLDNRLPVLDSNQYCRNSNGRLQGSLARPDPVQANPRPE
jgi:hypothetical protein